MVQIPNNFLKRACSKILNFFFENFFKKGPKATVNFSYRRKTILRKDTEFSVIEKYKPKILENGEKSKKITKMECEIKQLRRKVSSLE